ncbi:Sugar transporter, partial [Operophtera brumata]
LVVATSPQLAAFSLRGCLPYPTIILQQLKANDSSIHLGLETSSWIGSIYGFASIPVILMPILMQSKGRRFAYIVTCLFVIIGWILSLSATNIGMILASESFHGLGTNSLLPVSFLSLTEMLAPKYRYISMQLFGVSMAVGVATAGILGRFIHYKTVSSIMLVPIVIAVVLAFFWPESPPWFACKGDFEKCKKAFLWLRGSDEQSIIELKELITAQRQNLARAKPKKFTWQRFWRKITSRDFYIPSFHIFVLLNMLYWSGVDVTLIYFIEMVEKSTQNKDAIFYASILMYAIVLIGAIITNVTVRKFENKKVLLLSTSGVILCLIGACSATYLQSKELLPKDSLLCLYFLIGYIICCSLGLNAVVFFIAAELMPVKHRSIGGALYIICNCGLYASTLKISTYLFLYINMWGTFLVYTINALLCSLFVWKCVPETKGRTLQEIEDFYMYGSYRKRDLTEDNVLLGN